jgi:hypothetical protein
VIDEPLESFELPIEGLDDPINAGLELLGHDLPTVLLHGTQRNELPTAHDQVFDGLGVCVGSGTSEGLHGGGKARDQPGIDLIGFGELADGVSEAADLQRRDDNDGKTGGEGRTDKGLLETTGGFDDDALDAVAA